jgi:predicted RNA-binding Zn-ribbon protein involved in translation (DUF1610 family)
VVVAGDLDRGKYPTAYWGMLGSVGKKKTLNYAWSYKCPRCGEAVQRGSSAAAGVAGGAVGALLYSAFSSFQCKKCGPINKSEFPPEVQREMTTGSVGIVVTAVVVLVVALGLLVVLASWR